MLVNRLLHRALMAAAVPMRLRLMRDLEHRRSWQADRIGPYQDGKVRELIAYCWEHVPFYRAHWRGHIDGPDDVRSVSDLTRLPVLGKDLLRAHLGELTTTDPRVKSAPARTGGSTGQPTLFRMTRDDEELAWAQMYLAWQWAGWRVGDPFQAVGGQSIGIGIGDRRTWKDWVINRWTTSGSNLTVERTKHLVAQPHFHAVRFMYGYPSAIREFCDLLRTIGERPRSLRGVVCTAEIMRPEVRREISEALGGVPVHDQYGLNDGGLFAAEGPERDGLHLFFTRGVLEILDDAGQQVHETGRSGRAVATCLTNLATPFVRYETGDTVHWQSFAPSASGVGWPRIGPVDGRTGDVIYLPSGRRIAMPGLTLVMRWVDGLRQYQFIQTGPRAVVARLLATPAFTMGEEALLAYLRQNISDEIEWRVVWGEPELTQNQKLLIIRNDWLRGQGQERPGPAAERS